MIVFRRLPRTCCQITHQLRFQRCESTKVPHVVDTITTANAAPGIISTTGPPDIVSSISASIPDIVSSTGVTAIPELSAWYSAPIWAYQSLLEHVQLSSGLTWIGVLIGTGVVVRLCTVPFTVLLERSMVRTAPTLAKITKVQLELNKARAKGDQHTAMLKMQEVSYIKQQENYKSPFWWMIPNAVFAMMSFMSIRGIAELPYQPFLDTSLLWVPSLCVQDPYFILPAVNSLLITYTLKSGLDSGNNMAQLLSKPVAFVGMTVVMGLCQSFFPSSLVLYWLSSSVCSTLVIVPLLRKDWFRTKIGLTTMAEKNEAMAGSLTVQDINTNTRDLFKTVREVGHEKDMELRRKRAASLADNDWGDTNKLKDLEHELKTERDRLFALKENISKEFEDAENELKKLESRDYEKEQEMFFEKLNRELDESEKKENRKL